MPSVTGVNDELLGKAKPGGVPPEQPQPLGQLVVDPPDTSGGLAGDSNEGLTSELLRNVIVPAVAVLGTMNRAAAVSVASAARDGRIRRTFMSMYLEGTNTAG